MTLWRSIKNAPRDGTMIWLVVDYSGGENPLADARQAATIGFNNLDNTGEDKWEFAGWNWEQDCFTEGSGRVLGWAPIGFDLAQEEPQAPPEPPIIGRTELAGGAHG